MVRVIKFLVSITDLDVPVNCKLRLHSAMDWRYDISEKAKRRIMKKIFGLFFVLIFLAAFLNAAVAEERMVQLNIPGCSA